MILELVIEGILYIGKAEKIRPIFCHQGTKLVELNECCGTCITNLSYMQDYLKTVKMYENYVYQS